MPVKKMCRKIGCFQIAGPEGYCPTHGEYGRRLKRERESRYPCRSWQYLYNTKGWKTRRANQLKREPLCNWCKLAGRVELASIADHIEDHKGDKEKFFKGPLQSLCHRCHSIKTNQENGGRR